MLTNETNNTLFLGANESELFLALLFCFGLLLIGFKDKKFMLVAGPVWIFSGIAIFLSYGVAFMVISIGVGLVVLIDGAMSIS